jgi:hypothetical protein
MVDRTCRPILHFELALKVDLSREIGQGLSADRIAEASRTSVST